MKSSKTKINGVEDNNTRSSTVESFSNKEFSHVNRDIIITAIECSKRSGVPFLFLSNPGYGKTTDVYQYGKKFGYHVEVLSGDQFARDEILGYQVNEPGGTHLLSKEPEWFSRIMAAKEGTLQIPNEPEGVCYLKGTPSILFLDEISVAPSDVQGAMLQLSKDRCIHGGKFLPKDCIVLSAANYKSNLPGYCNIISPQLNRFCLVNLLPGSINDKNSSGKDNVAVLSEFLQVIDDSEIIDDSFPRFNADMEDYQMSSERKHELLDVARSQIAQLLLKFEKTSDGSKGYLDLRNVNYDGIYDREDEIPEVYNFLTGRSVHNLIKVTIALCEMGVTKNNDIYKKFVDGLVGLGTNNWDDSDPAAYRKQLSKYQEEWYKIISSLIDRFNVKNIVNSTPQKSIKHLNKFNDASTIPGAIRQFIQSRDANGSTVYDSQEYKDLKKMILDKLSSSNMENVAKSLNTVQNVTSFRSEIENIKELCHAMEHDGKKKDDLKSFKNLLFEWDFYYNSSFMGVTSEQVA